MKQPGKLLSNEIKKAASVLNNGGVVIFPTDTVYGIGCRFDDQKAIDRIYEIKNTPKSQSFPILLSNFSQVNKLVIVTKVGRTLINKYWPGALTIILPSRSQDRKIGLRMPDSALIRSFIKKVGAPIIGTSANFHGQNAVKSFKDLNPKLVRLVDYVIKGECRKGIESTVVDATSASAKVLRQGAIKL